MPKVEAIKILEAWAGQLANDVGPFLSVAASRGNAVQVVLFVGDDGKVGKAKVTVTTKGGE